jgi:crotonobetainyl-CoA:carnitine CoA-transferase CaiB-like acyl-CoA transferase
VTHRDAAEALSGVRVVDFGQYLAGPLVAQMLGDLGASVTRVDPPGGPRWDTDANAILQRGKRSIVLDLKKADDLVAARRLIEDADVLVENFRPGVMARLGLSYEDLRQTNPGLVFCSVPGFASTDPRASVYAHEGVVSAAAGLYPQRDFDPTRQPIVNTLPLASVLAAIIATNSVMAALISRERTGTGQRVETSLFDASFELTRTYGDRVLTDEPPDADHRQRRPANFQLGGSNPPPLADFYRCSDGVWVHLSWLEERQMIAFAELVGKRDEWDAKGYLGVSPTGYWADPRLSREVHAELASVIAQRTAKEWERLAGTDCDLGVCQTTSEWLLYDEQARESEAVITLPDPVLGLTHQLGHGVALRATPPRARPRQPLDEGPPELDVRPKRIDARLGVAESVRPNAALEGVLVVDTSQILAGPTASRILAEYGADVVQVMNPDGRAWGGYHRTTNGGKRSVMLNLKTSGGSRVLWKLLERADVLATNFSESVAERLGLGEATVRVRRPDIIYSRLSAHGPDGPRAEHRGHDNVAQAVTGMERRFGQDAEHPMMQPYALNDIGCGHLTALAVLVALFHRQRTGEGQLVGSSLAQAASMYQLPYMVAHAGRAGEGPGGHKCLGVSPTERLYSAKDGWFFLGAPDTLETRRRIDSVEGLGGLLDTESDLAAELERRFRTEPREVWVDRLVAAGLGAHVWNTIEAAMGDAWARANGLSVDVEFPGVGPGRIVGPTPRLSETPMRMGRPVSPMGADTAAVLEEIGFAPEMDELVASGAVRLPAYELEDPRASG